MLWIISRSHDGAGNGWPPFIGPRNFLHFEGHSVWGDPSQQTKPFLVLLREVTLRRFDLEEVVTEGAKSARAN